MEHEQRKSSRRTLRYTAWLLLEGNRLHGCSLFDMSETGARIEFEETETLPERFWLILSGNGKARRMCRLMWRNQDQIGVSFEPRARAPERATLVPKIEPFGQFAEQIEFEPYDQD